MSSLPPPKPRARTGEVTTEEVMTEAEKQTHLIFMREALAMAELALNTNETPVGCVFVHRGTIIGRGMNATNRTYNGTRHAEFMAISAILSGERPLSGGGGEEEGSTERGRYGRAEVLKECDLYVTVEPCIMCASLLRQFGVRKVYYGATNEKFGGTGGVLSVHLSNGRTLNGDEVGGKEEGDYEVSGGWLVDEAVHMLQRFYMQENERAPEPKARGKKGGGVGLEGIGIGVEGREIEDG